MHTASSNPNARRGSGALLCALLALGAAFASAPSARAAETATAPSDTTKPVLFLKETVVTGSRYPRAYYESPQALSFVTRAQLRDQEPTVIGDVLGGLPGVDNSKDSPWEQRPVLRGLSGQRVLVLMDGSPMNSARGNGPHPSLVAPAQVERIEVVRGPSSVAYGSDALGGAINIITREAPRSLSDRSLAGSASVGGSTVDQQGTAYLELVPRVGRFSAFLSSGGRKAQDFETPNGAVPNSQFKDYNALFNLRYDFGERTALKTGYQLYRGSDIGIPGLSFDSPGARQSFQFSHYDRDFAHLTLDQGYRSAWLANTRARLYYQRESRNFFSDQDLASTMFGSFGVPPRAGAASATTEQDRFFNLDTWGAQLQATSIRSARTLFTAGLDATSDRTDGDNVRRRTYYDAGGNPIPGPGGSAPTAVRTTASVPDGRFDNYGAFTQAEVFLSPKWSMSAGGRFTQYRYRTEAGLAAPASGAPGSQPVNFEALKVDDGAFSGSLGTVYEPVQDLHVSANVASGYRQPNAQELFFEGSASVGYVIGNSSLSSERSVSYDAGLRWGPGALALSGNLFWSSYQDLIDAISVPPVPQSSGQPTYQYVNISDARIWGGEAEAEWRFLPQWKARAAIAGAIGDITSREAIMTLYGVAAEQAPLPGVPPFKGSASLRWSNASGAVWVEPSVRASWRTNRLPLPTPGVPFATDFKSEWVAGDLFAGAKFGAQRVLVGVRNFTDTPYRQALGSIDEPGISFVGSISADF
jgi:hemoglobin/transferrin/lactoferrin receptor protein